jgi:hypothetical protein
MSDDCRISMGLPSHPKTRKVERRLGDAGFAGLVKLLLFVARDKSDGDLSGMSDEDIEIAAEWKGESGAFVRVLSEVRFLDGLTGAHTVHDWAAHNPWAAARGVRVEAARKAAVGRWLSGRMDRPRMRSASPAHPARMRTACRTHKRAMLPTQPDPDPIPDQTKVKNSCASAPANVTKSSTGSQSKLFIASEAAEPPILKSQHTAVKECIDKHYRDANGLPCPWNGRTGKLGCSAEVCR